MEISNDISNARSMEIGMTEQCVKDLNYKNWKMRDDWKIH